MSEVEAKITGIESLIEPFVDTTQALNEQAEVEREGELSFAFSRRHHVLFKGIEDGEAHVLYIDATPLSALSEVRRSLRHPLRLEKVKPELFEKQLQLVYEQATGSQIAMMEDFGEDLDLSRIAEGLPETADLLESDDDAPIIRLINAMLTEAIKQGSSDIHVEPFENKLLIRFRIDGVLREVLQQRRAMAPLIVSRIKVMASLDIAEKRLPQDGRISLRIAGRAVDVRVSTLPCGHGERVVLRLLDKQAGRMALEQLNMPQQMQADIQNIIHKPNGIFLVTGPTGSGKSTTLYASLTELNKATRSILTVEDPIEYYLEGVGQTQVNTKVEMTFARGLRAILRQDPDVVMIGEIRDLETAQIAVQASLTGHLVLSSLHTNTAIGAVTRLHDMGIEPFLVASSLVGVLAQRLVRLLCPVCKIAVKATPTECQELECDPADPPTIYRPAGCEKCNQTGYRGRTGVFELVMIDDTTRALIHSGAPEYELEKHARTRTQSLRREAFHRVLAGETSLEEVLRVTRED